MKRSNSSEKLCEAGVEADDDASAGVSVRSLLLLLGGCGSVVATAESVEGVGRACFIDDDL